MGYVEKRAAELLASVQRAERQLYALEKIPLEDVYSHGSILRVTGRRAGQDLIYVLVKVVDDRFPGGRWYITGWRNPPYLEGWEAVQEWLAAFVRIDEVVEMTPVVSDPPTHDTASES